MKGKIWKFLRWLIKTDDWIKFFTLNDDYLLSRDWFEAYQEEKMKNDTWRWERRLLEKKAGGRCIPNPKVVKSWGTNDVPASPDEPFYIFEKFKTK